VKCDTHRRNCDLANKQIETMPAAPSVDDIIARAEDLYDFVCRK
jgi:hypothetical protein